MKLNAIKSILIGLLLQIGAPLSEIDLSPLEDLGHEIRTWILNRSQGKSDTSDINMIDKTPLKTKQENDDLYDF